MQHLKSLSGAKASYFHWKARINYFRALEDRNTDIPYHFMPKLLLTEPTENTKIYKKWPLVLWLLFSVKALEVFHRRLTILLSLHEYNLGL